MKAKTPSRPRSSGIVQLTLIASQRLTERMVRLWSPDQGRVRHRSGPGIRSATRTRGIGPVSVHQHARIQLLPNNDQLHDGMRGCAVTSVLSPAR